DGADDPGARAGVEGDRRRSAGGGSDREAVGGRRRHAHAQRRRGEVVSGARGQGNQSGVDQHVGNQDLGGDRAGQSGRGGASGARGVRGGRDLRFTIARVIGDQETSTIKSTIKRLDRSE